MNRKRSFHKRGTLDLPIAFYKINAKDSNLSASSYWHPELEMGMVMQGTITMRIQDTTYSFTKGDIYIVLPDQLHGLCNVSKEAVRHLLIIDLKAVTMTREHFFQKTFVEPLTQGRMTMPKVLRRNHPAYEAVAQQMLRLGKVMIYSQGYKLVRYSAVLQICTALQPYCRIQEAAADTLPVNEIAKQCIAYIRDHYAEKLTLMDIAAGCSTHPNYLCAVFKKHTGQTVMEYLNRTRVEIGAKRLQDRKASISGIMAAVGFSSEETFRENFRKFKGVTPREYRKTVICE